MLFSGSVAENIAKGRADTESKPLLTLPEVLEQQRQQNTSSSPSCETVCGCCLHEDRKAVPTEEQNDIEMATKPQDEKVGKSLFFNLFTNNFRY